MPCLFFCLFRFHLFISLLTFLYSSLFILSLFTVCFYGFFYLFVSDCLSDFSFLSLTVSFLCAFVFICTFFINYMIWYFIYLYVLKLFFLKLRELIIVTLHDIFRLLFIRYVYNSRCFLGLSVLVL